MNKIDIVYYINLAHRTDRKEHLLNELSKVNYDESRIKRIDGIYVNRFGILGCGLSHIKTLTEFLNTPDDIQSCLILEDDFEFTENKETVDIVLNKIFDNVQDIDVLMISGNILDSSDTEYHFIKRIQYAQTTSGYYVRKQFAPHLLNNLIEGCRMLESVGRPIHEFSLDVYWARLLKHCNWYVSNPKLGKQMASYSDIEEKKTDYGV